LRSIILLALPSFKSFRKPLVNGGIYFLLENFHLGQQLTAQRHILLGGQIQFGQLFQIDEFAVDLQRPVIDLFVFDLPLIFLFG
jgi:hypothetical protein